MKTIIALAASLLIVSPALAVTPEQVKECTTQFRVKNKADNEAAPAGYRPKRERGYREKFIAECLTKA